MTRRLVPLVASTLALVASTGAGALGSDGQRRAAPVRQLRSLSLELVGQFQNSPPGVTPPTHTHYGYLSYVSGVRAFSGSAESEATALFTFFADAATPRVIANGPLRIITRAGVLTIYRDASPDGDFAKAESFRDGTPVLVARFRQQVVSDTVTGSFTAYHQDRIVSTRRFPSGRGNVELGRVGEKFRTYFSGHVTMPGPPSGVLGGYAVSG